VDAMLQSSFIKKSKMIDEQKNNLLLTHWSLIRNNLTCIDNNVSVVTENFSNFAAFIKAEFKKEQLVYPKFYKMDSLSKLGFLTAEKLIRASHVLEHYRPEEIGIVLFNSSASLDTDISHQKTIDDRSSYFPSPSVFVYTLANIVIGEICIRNKINGENAFFISEKFDASLIISQIRSLMSTGRTKACIAGWVEVLGDEFESVLILVEKEFGMPEKVMNTVAEPLTIEKINSIYHINPNTQWKS
jgi:hypothetical protein